MSKRVLLVTGDAALLRELGDALDAPEDDLSVMQCPDDVRGLKRLTDFHPDFVIVSLALAPDPTKPVSDYGGLRFCEAAIEISQVPIALVTPSPVPDAVIDKLGSLGKTVSPHQIGDGYIAKLLQQIRTAKPPPKHLEIIIEAKAGNRWSYALRSENFDYPFKRMGTLSFDLGAQDACKTLSDVISSIPEDWEAKFTRLGRSIVTSLFGVDSSFIEEVRQGVQEAGGLNHTRVVFEVGTEQYELPLEAVFPPIAVPRYPWMIHAPLLRNIRGMTAANTPLFDERRRRRKRCLIVGANTSGYCDEILEGGSSIKLGELSHIKSECEAVEALFKDAQREVGFEDPKVVGTDPAKPLSKNDFQSLLTEPWDVIHFAGHAYHSPAVDQNGAPTAQHACLFVGKPGAPEAMEMNTIAPSLRETTSLLYLSGCKTANAGFAVAAAQYGVPAVLGFRWKVQDKPAEQHARLFYHQLFREKAIDKAFRNTRRGMRMLNRKDNAWASGMLVMASQ